MYQRTEEWIYLDLTDWLVGWHIEEVIVDFYTPSDLTSTNVTTMNNSVQIIIDDLVGDIFAFANSDYQDGYDLGKQEGYIEGLTDGLRDLDDDGYDDSSFFAGKQYYEDIFGTLGDINTDGHDDSSFNAGKDYYEDLFDSCISWTDTDNDGYMDCSYTAGYNVGLTAELDLTWWTAMIDFTGSIFQKEIFPNVSIGLLASIPITFALFKWLLRYLGN